MDAAEVRNSPLIHLMQDLSLLLLRIWRMLLQGWSDGWTLVVAAGGNFEDKGVGEVEADEAFGGNLDLLAASDGVGSGSDTTAGSGSDGCAFASAEDAAEDGSDSCSAANFLGCVGAAAFALDAVGIGVDGETLAATVDAGEFDGEQRAALVVGRLLYSHNATGDGSAVGDDDDAVGDDVGCGGSGEGVTLLGGGTVESLRDADRDGGARSECNVAEGRWWRRRWRGWGLDDGRWWRRKLGLRGWRFY